jgi:hypothetical protein
LLDLCTDGEAFRTAFLATNLFRLYLVPRFLALPGLKFFYEGSPGKETVKTLAALLAATDPHAGRTVNEHHTTPS